MAHVESMTIDGLLGRPDPVIFNFDRYINILYGKNGTGKTSILTLLHAILSQDPDVAKRVPFKSATAVIFSRNHNVSYIHTLTKRLAERPVSKHGDGPKIPRSKVVIDATITPTVPDSPPIKGAWQHEYLPAYRLFEYLLTEDVSSFNNLSQSAIDSHFESAINQLWLRANASIQKEVDKQQMTTMGKILAALIANPSDKKPGHTSPLDATAIYDRLLGFFGQKLGQVFTHTDFRKAFAESNNLQTVVSIFSELERDIAVCRKPKSSLESFVSSLFCSGKTVSFSESGIDVVTSDETPIGIKSLSSGEKHVLRILLGGYHAKFSSLIIDEPELSLHVDWQEKLLGILRELNDECQIIVATHSPEIVASTKLLATGQVFELTPPN